MKDQIIGCLIIISWIASIIFLIFTNDIIINKIISVGFVSWKLYKMIHDALKE
jgi:hypothetical protein